MKRTIKRTKRTNRHASAIYRKGKKIYIKKSLIILTALLTAVCVIGFNSTRLLNDLTVIESVNVPKDTKPAEKPVTANPVAKKEYYNTDGVVKFATINGNWSKEQLAIRTKTELTIRKIAKEMDFKHTDYLIKIADCESMLGLKLTNNQGNYPKNSIDEGYFMWNSHWQKDINEKCAFNLDCETREAIKKVNSGGQGIWVCDKIVKGKVNFR